MSDDRGKLLLSQLGGEFPTGPRESVDLKSDTSARQDGGDEVPQAGISTYRLFVACGHYSRFSVHGGLQLIAVDNCEIAESLSKQNAKRGVDHSARNSTSCAHGV